MRLGPKMLIGFLMLFMTIGCVWIISIVQLDQTGKQLTDLKSSGIKLRTDEKLLELALKMQYYDEVLTQSARNYAFTEDIKWKDRYKEAELNLDKIIKESISLEDKTDYKFFTDVDTANVALVKIEYDALDLVEHDKAADAIKILESKQYQDLKNIYSKNVNANIEKHKRAELATHTEHTQSINLVTNDIQSSIQDTMTMLKIAVPTILVLAILFAFFVSRHVIMRLDILTHGLKRTTIGDFGSQIKINGDDEISDLTKSFNSMSLQLQNYTKREEMEKTKDEFMAMISHELKTPLVPISGYTGLLLAGKYGDLTSTQQEKIKIIQSSVQSLSKLMSDLLDAQKIDMGKLRLDLKNERLDTIILYTVKKIESITTRAGIQITTDLRSDLQCICDKTRIEQTISNLLLNSIDFCPKNTGKIHITANILEECQFAKIIVSDNGIGISKEKEMNLFTKFYQGDTNMTREHGGTGLGLAVCKGIVENHGGKIWAKSDGIGKGIQVHIMLPHAEITQEKIQIVDSA